MSYKRDAPTNIFSLNIPMEAAANKDQVEEYQVILRFLFVKLLGKRMPKIVTSAITEARQVLKPRTVLHPAQKLV